MIQDLSHPRGSSAVQSINARVSPDEFTAAYSTFPIVSLLMSSLPPGSQGAVQDVAEVYRTIPVHLSQWHGLVVCLSDSHFAIDTALCFGFGPSAGIYGNVVSAGADIMHFIGIGPILQWVDDHLFICIPHIHLHSYNEWCREAAAHIAAHGGPAVHGGQFWFKGSTLPDGSIEEYNEDCTSEL